ncbi:type I restriction-modification system endonuclease [Pygmaiobacter massiliensis]|uniref:type I restriction-modification system endonuclease n=1 Tax=Pygmaiobacter massiliensis TaxID=1917873 RepID=UPI000C7DF64E|nr:type I restriction-modification system endonuclease [Pygmaiobacter massiliensis]
MKSNFDFLHNKFAVLYEIGQLAEKYLYSDSNSCLIKLGMMGETVVNLMLKLDGIAPPNVDNTHANRIRLLKREGLLPRDIDDILYALRTTRNDAIHQNFADAEKCKTLLEMAYTLSVWFMQTYGDWNFNAGTFILPSNDMMDFDAIILEKETMIEKLTQKIDRIEPQNISNNDRQKQANKAASLINLSEKETRYLIDEQLRLVGWEADTDTLRYAKGARPQKGRNIAIAEWPTNSQLGSRGFADYALFVGTQLVAIVEAKKALIDVPNIIDVQCKDYARNIKDDDSNYIIGQWQGYKVPFVFATNGRKYLEQYKEKSGIWFLDLRNETNISKSLRGWVSPQGILEWLEKDIAATNSTLQNISKDLLTDKDGLNLREYQVEAISAVENTIVSGAQTALLSMATGTGKTRTILGMVYRFLKSKRFNRILFLIDRTALGEQAQDVFKEVKLEDVMTLDKIYNIKNLEEKEIDPETKIQVATVQSLVKRIIYNTGEAMPAVSDYDLIIIDEAHRGYILDKEAGEDELLYRNQDDFVSKYRTVIEYFDAVKVGLTATPALHTTEIFGKPVFEYSYRRAVVEGFLVDHDAPHNLTTKLSEDGITYEKGDIVPVYDPNTGEITNSAELADELKFDVEQFNRRVITENFNRAVLEEIANDINPTGMGKTLIYAVDDNHADMIVDILREIYEPYGISNNAIMKITSKSGDKKRVLELIRAYKNEQYPNIAVTVDLLTTGIDVPEITTLVFMRRVKSRILYEQMLGRATRLCDKIGKTHFEIYDPVGVYESLQDVSTMKPVVANANATFIDLLNGLEELQTDAQIQNQIDMIIAKIRRKQKRMTTAQKERFEHFADGKTPTEFIEQVKALPASESRDLLLSKQDLFYVLNEGGIDARRAVVISDKEDELRTHTRGYGKGQKPQDYLEEFRTFISENADKIEALKLVCTRPAELTRSALKSLRIELDSKGFTETQLNSAWKQTTNEDITADIISFIRSQAIGSQLLSHSERIQKAVEKLKSAHRFSKMELDWLDRIEKFLLTETVLNEETFNLGAFRDFGGFNRIDKLFKNKLNEYIIELNQYLYDDGGKVA